MNHARLRGNSIRQMLIKTCFLIFVFPLCITWITLLIASSSSIRNTAIDNRKALVEFMNTVLEKELIQMETDIKAICNDSTVNSILKNTDFEQYNSKLYNDFKYLDKLITRIIGTSRHVDSVVIVNMQGKVYSNQYISDNTKSNIPSSDWYRRTTELWGKINLIGQQTNDKGTRVFCIARFLMDDNFNKLGVIRISYSEDLLLEAVRDETNPSSTVYLINDDGEILFSSDARSEDEVGDILKRSIESVRSNSYFEEKFDKKNVLFISSSTNRYGLRIVNRIDSNFFTAQLRSAQLYIVILTLCCIFLFFAFVLSFYRSFSGPITRILSYIKSMPDGGEADMNKSYTCYELNELSDGVLTLVRREKDGEEKIVKLAHQCEVTELEKLQAQINPHFLYNTLTSIKYVASENANDTISGLMTALVKLLRNSINRDGSFISVGQELENLRQYLYIEGCIYKNNFEAEIHMPEDLENYLLPTFILQPIVENCIFHGIDPNDKGGRICLSLRIEEPRLLIEIADNGRGMDPALIEKHMEYPSEHRGNNLTNLGLAGVHQKIRLLCGKEYGLSIFTAKNKGTTIVITLPLVRGGKGDPGA